MTHRVLQLTCRRRLGQRLYDVHSYHDSSEKDIDGIRETVAVARSRCRPRQ